MNLGRDTIEPLISSCSRNLHLHLFTDSSNEHLLNLYRDGTYSLPKYREWYERARDWDWGSQHLKRRGRRPREWDRRSKVLPFLACGSSLVPLSHFSGSVSLVCKPFLTLSPPLPLETPHPSWQGSSATPSPFWRIRTGCQWSLPLLGHLLLSKVIGGKMEHQTLTGGKVLGISSSVWLLCTVVAVAVLLLSYQRANSPYHHRISFLATQYCLVVWKIQFPPIDRILPCSLRNDKDFLVFDPNSAFALLLGIFFIKMIVWKCPHLSYQGRMVPFWTTSLILKFLL